MLGRNRLLLYTGVVVSCVLTSNAVAQLLPLWVKLNGHTSATSGTPPTDLAVDSSGDVYFVKSALSGSDHSINVKYRGADGSLAWSNGFPGLVAHRLMPDQSGGLFALENSYLTQALFRFSA